MVLYLHSLSPVLTKLCKVDIISTLEMKSISVNSFQGTKIIQKIKTERRILVIQQWHLLFRIDVVNSLLRIRYLSQSIRSCSRKQPSSWGCQCGCQSLSHTLLSVTPWTVYGILQARILEWVAFPFSRGIFPTQGSNPGLPHYGQILYQLSHKGSPRTLEWVTYPFSSRSCQSRN